MRRQRIGKARVVAGVIFVLEKKIRRIRKETETPGSDKNVGL